METMTEFLRSLGVEYQADGRRRWSHDAKAYIVAETLRPGATVKSVAGKFGVNANRLSEWRSLAKEADDLIDWLRIMSNERFRRLPVVDDEGRIQAVFTQGDFVSYTWPDLLYQMKSIAAATVIKNWPLYLIGGGIALYLILMVIVIGLMT